ncbi:glycoside hydrolase family 3 N-terminal domain-containing protein [Microbacterium karelineae]|uniref:glycoside hydrolase family 3 N-terminal domain-containing protein n=1 Tax=Microbacterium karelineae TaxID=2654283 RepID=UPI0018D2F49E|nr:glycoside hydrolase family 3 N-terminal domain-containing protein [Microbacterium karelineae]
MQRADPGLDRLANGVLWPGFLGTGTPDWIRREREAGLAGVVLFAQNLGGDPVDPSGGFLVGIDEEGGTVTRLDAARGSAELGAAQLGALDDIAVTRAVGERLARRSAAAGANVVIAPDADVNADPRNPVIGTRAFGADARLVARHVRAAIAGIHAGGAIAVPKHFPGHGDTATDSHHGLAVTGASERQQREVHLAPFAAAIDAGARMIMTAHLVVPAWGADPATANPRALAELRGLGFGGVIASDALDMAAVRERFGGDAPVRALAAGCDLLCVSNPANPGGSGDDEGDFLAVRARIVDAVRSGELATAGLEEAAARVAELRSHVRGMSPAGEAPALDGLALAVRAARVAGSFDALPGPRVVVDARAAATWAVSSTGSRFAEDLARGGSVVSPDADPAGEAPVVLVDRVADPAQSDAIARVAARHPGGVVVNLGVETPDPLPLPTIHVRAASLLAVRAADAILAGARMDP